MITTVEYNKNALTIGENVFDMQYIIKEAFLVQDKVIVLIDPDSYLADAGYSKERRRGINAYKNLRAYSLSGILEWKAEFPEDADCYYSILSQQPLVANSFSSFKCEIDIKNGSIKSKIFFK